MHANASATQLDSAIVQNNKLLIFFSRKLLSLQQLNAAVDRELLSTSELLKECRTALLQEKITVCVDHQNTLSVDATFPSRVKRWELNLEDCKVELRHVKGKSKFCS